ncbi:hypothetical protein [uncultured Sulfitobacter sp.]|uniref:hypothetical protein n=1 Tax=Sulfitobacter sp. SH22 TaxID=3421172 RepID=UPI0025EFA67D|nr:hypothetical protein [uncultured Sulfitobacter sp.]
MVTRFPFSHIAHVAILVVLANLVAAFDRTVGAQEVNEQRFERFIRLAQVEPLYAWPGVDLDDMGRAISALNRSRAEILRFADQYNDTQKARIASALYPTAYLERMRALEAQRRALAFSTKTDQLEAYQVQLERTIDAHLAYLTELQSAMSATADEVNYKGLEYHFGRSSFAHFIGGVEAYQAEAMRSLQKAKERWNCFKEEKPPCEAPSWRAIAAPHETDYDTEVFDQTPARITKAIREGGRLGGKAVGRGWAILNGSECYGKNAKIPFLTWTFPTGSGVPIFRPEVVSDVLVHDHQIDETSNAYERILDTLGMSGFLFQPHTNLYACPDAAKSSARLRAMVFLYEFAGQFQWSSMQSANEEISVALAQAAQAFSKLQVAEVLTEFDTEKAAYEASKLLSSFEHNELIGALGEDRTRLLETAVLTYRLRTPYFSQDIMNLVYGNTAIADYVPYAPWGYLEELIFTRNAPDLLLGGTNPSIIRQSYSQIEQPREGVSPRLRSYVMDLSTQFSEAEMIEILLNGLKAEYRLGRLQDRPYIFTD